MTSFIAQKLYADTEFNGFGGELVSFALVPADETKPELYVVLEPSVPYLPWVAEHVVPFFWTGIPVGEIISRQLAARKLASYLRGFENPVVIADWPEDLSHLLNLFMLGGGMMVNTPDFDLQYRHFPKFNTSDASQVPHNAFWDARALREHALQIT